MFEDFLAGVIADWRAFARASSEPGQRLPVVPLLAAEFFQLQQLQLHLAARRLAALALSVPP